MLITPHPSHKSTGKRFFILSMLFLFLFFLTCSKLDYIYHFKLNRRDCFNHYASCHEMEAKMDANAVQGFITRGWQTNPKQCYPKTGNGQQTSIPSNKDLVNSSKYTLSITLQCESGTGVLIYCMDMIVFRCV